MATVTIGMNHVQNRDQSHEQNRGQNRDKNYDQNYDYHYDHPSDDRDHHHHHHCHHSVTKNRLAPPLRQFCSSKKYLVAASELLLAFMIRNVPPVPPFLSSLSLTILEKSLGEPFGSSLNGIYFRNQVGGSNDDTLLIASS